MGDLNVPMTTNNAFIKMLNNIGMRKVITSKYGCPLNPPPSTYRHRKHAIDGIFTTENIEFLQRGIWRHPKCKRDHPWIWGDFTVTSILGGKIDAFTHLILKKLSCKLPAIKDRYNKIIDAEFKRMEVVTKLDQLISQCWEELQHTGRISKASITAYNNLNSTIEAGIKYTDRKCKKAHKGMVPFSLTMKKLQGTAFMWGEILKYRLWKKKRNLHLLQRLAKKWDFHETWLGLTITTI